MLNDLHGNYVEDTASDMQNECIETFFDENHDWWLQNFQIDLSESKGTDEETMRMIDLVLINLKAELQPHIITMLNDWKEEGF